MFKDYIIWKDIPLVMLYFMLLYALMFFIKKKNPGNPLTQQYLLKGFIFKIAGALFYGLLIYYYYDGGDSLSYFRNALILKQEISLGNASFNILLQDPKYIMDTYGLHGMSKSGWVVERISLLLCYISFSRYLVVTMLFATVAYSGMFKMFKTFAEIMPEWHRQLAFVVLFFPTLSIYGSGILKDTLAISSLGWIMYSSNQLFIKKHFRLKYIIALALCVAIIAMVKAYIIFAFAAPYIIYLLMSLVKKIPSRFFRRIILPSLLGILTLLYILNAEKIDNVLGSYAIEKLFDNVKEQQQSYLSMADTDAGSTFDLGSFEPTLSGFLTKMPAGINATLYRPYLWEARKLLMLFSALESFLILAVTIYVIWKAGLIKFIKTIFNDPFIFLCLSFSLIFAAIVGLSTFNFGTLARYRIPAIPFYLTGILAILYRVKKIIPKKPHEKIA